MYRKYLLMIGLVVISGIAPSDGLQIMAQEVRVEKDIVVASIDYRLTDVAGWPAQINDCYAAVRWIRDHANQYNVASDRIGFWGTSAGAHLAILMGTRPDPLNLPTSQAHPHQAVSKRYAIGSSSKAPAMVQRSFKSGKFETACFPFFNPR